MRFLIAALVLIQLGLGACSGGSSSGGGAENGGSDSSNFGCSGGCSREALSSADVRTLLSQLSVAADLTQSRATAAVVDRVGNVLAVYQMSGAATTTRITGKSGASGGLEGAVVPATLAAISKAGTGAFLSSQGNAFSTRTASQIVQANFIPGENNAVGGPLFGVQFSQLPCSDVTRSAGPRPLPLGLSADPGGFPLYKNGDLVGGIGVEFDGEYTLDLVVTDRDEAPEEIVALLASQGFGAPSERTANLMSVGGKTLRYSDVRNADLPALPEIFAAIDENQIVSVPPFFAGEIVAGSTFGAASSGIVDTVRAGAPSALLTDGGGAARFSTRAGSSISAGRQLAVDEVNALLDSALLTAERTRAAIRRPLDSAARVSIWIVDTEGLPIGFTRSQDAPVFGVDVALQKARAANFFSRSDAGSRLSAAGFGSYVSAMNGFFGRDVLNGSVAFSARAVGNIARPFFLDGINGNPPGPLSLPFPGTPGSTRSWSPFNTGLQLDLILSGVTAPLSGVIPASCTSAIFGSTLRNGIQIFPGGFPLYRGATLIGAIGVSGDGIDQDDLVAFYAATRNGLDFAGHVGVGDVSLGFNAPVAMRSDELDLPIENARLRYVSCPEAPFIADNEQRVCAAQ